MIAAAHELGNLNVPPGNRLEKLKGDLKEYHSIRINAKHKTIVEALMEKETLSSDGIEAIAHPKPKQ
jgi:plasmid maintenance system killer protein